MADRRVRLVVEAVVDGDLCGTACPMLVLPANGGDRCTGFDVEVEFSHVDTDNRFKRCQQCIAAEGKGSEDG